MIVYYVVFVIMFLAPLFCSQFKENKNKIYCIIMGITLALVFGFRSEELGMNDVSQVYMPMFRQVKGMSFSEVISYYPFERGNLLQILTKAISIFVPDEHIWLFIISLPMVVTATLAVYKFSSFPQMSFFLLFGSYIFLTHIFLIRNSLALSMIILSYIFIEKKRYILSVIFFIAAVMFHTTAIFFVFAFVLVRFKINWKIYLGSIVLAFVLISNSQGLFVSLFKIIDDGYYSNFSNQTDSAISMYFIRYLFFLIMYIILYFVNKKNLRVCGTVIKIKNNKEEAISLDDNNFAMMCMSVVFMSLTSVIPEFYRIGMFYGFFGVIGLSNEIHMCNNKMLRNICIAFLIIVYSWFIYGGINDANLAPYKSWLFN